MRLDAAGSLPRVLFPTPTPRQHLASTRPCPGYTALSNEMKFSEWKTHLGFCHTFLVLPSTQGFFWKAQACKGLLAAHEKWAMSHLLASRMSQLSYEGEECQQNFTSHKEKVPAQDVAALPRGLAAAVVQPEALPPNQAQDNSDDPAKLSPKENTERAGRERGKHGAQRGKSPHTRSQLHTATQPRCVPSGKCLSLSGPPSHEGGTALSLCRQAGTTHSVLAFT